MDLVAALGRQFQNPFGYPTQAQQATRPTPTPTPAPYTGLRAIDIQSPKIQRQLSGEEPLP